MKNGNEKKSFFERLTGGNKAKKSSCCCNVEIEEIPEETVDEKDSNAQKEETNTAHPEKSGCGCNGNNCC